ncbi:MAG TPA: hypothetical protein VGR71_16695 [Nitrospira sp.]|nr:hypothetical protein [Nitrospira sp.]
MVTRIVYDTEFIDDGVTITPLSVAMRRSDGAELYAVTDDLSAMARAADSGWLRENVLRWLPVTIEYRDGYGVLNAHVKWDDEHPDYAKITSLEAIREMVEDFVLAKPDPELWAYYAAYDHVLYAQLFGPMSELPDGMPMFTLDIKQLCVSLGDPKLPELPEELVAAHFGERMEHHALYDVYEEEYRLNWLRSDERMMAQLRR